MVNRRHCTYCCLQKCFNVGMRKEWIRSEEEKQLKKYQIENNRQLKQKKNEFNKNKNNIKQTIQTLSLLSNDKSSLTQDDWCHLNNIFILYDQKAKPVVLNRHSLNTTTINEFVNKKSVWVMQLLSYFKQIPEFQKINVDDQVLLTKYNFRVLIPINLALIRYKLASTTSPSDHIDFMISVHGKELYQNMRKNVLSISLFQHDPMIIKLMLIIMLFSGCLLTTTSQMEINSFQNIYQIYTAQNFYAKLLWCYMEYVFGESGAIVAFSMFISRCLRIQLVSNDVHSCLKRQLNLDDILPLMQSVLQLN
ncbi:unnamed protein product [Didymodactylos carnosus]|uniref:Uncharacterized protein n=1 Tax=Didymodactylos carnosus TaxID=1234261 RepID=A0A814RPW4_9BILA|nr:unnamed protein product [Didymodactylos carnosus]CAF1137170.1 unnamed protein product [Didymodactylos carnosus]CAF3665673.1 unnamed protein product [Didymodactylos carnosus]CAF3900868.1 unnamed protein product [Didymodactylos carnosus]